MISYPRETNHNLSKLRVDGPHWASELTLYDGNLQQVQRQLGTLEKEVAPGLYEVEASMAGEIERQVVFVPPASESFIPATSWHVRFPSNAPLERTSTLDPVHRARAETLSREVSASPLGKGNSRLFIFLRRIDTGERDARVFPLNQLFLARSKTKSSISNLDQELSILRGDWLHGDQREGWLGVTLELPHGHYVLGSPSIDGRLNFYSIWLCAEMETHIFAQLGLSLGTASKLTWHTSQLNTLDGMTISMAPLGRGFVANDEEAIAAELVLYGLRRGRNMVSRGQMDMLLHNKFDNPWLGILGAHALLLEEKAKLQDPVEGEPEYERLRIVLGNLQQMLGYHSDLHALQLAIGQNTRRPVLFPPMLWQSMKLIQEQATKEFQILLPGSPLDSVLDTLLTRSPWVAWRDSQNNTRPASRHETDAPPTEPHHAAIHSLEDAARIERWHGWDRLLWQRKAALVYRNLALQLDALKYLAEGLTPEETSWDTVVFEPISVESVLSSLEPAEISAQVGVPLSRASSALSSFRLEPSLLTDTEVLSPIENAIADCIMTAAQATSRASAEISLRSRIPRRTSRLSTGPGVTTEQLLTALDETMKTFARFNTRDRYVQHIDLLHRASLGLAAQAPALLITDHTGAMAYIDTAYPKFLDIVASNFGNRTTDVQLHEHLLEWARRAEPGTARVSLEDLPDLHQVITCTRIQVMNRSELAMAYINKFHLTGYRPIDQSKLKQIFETILAVAQYAILLEQGSAKHQNRYLNECERHLASLVRNTQPR